MVEVKSKASGEVLAVHAETGDVVEAGHLLVEIDKRTPRNSLSQTEAALTAAQARRQIAQTQMERAQALFKSQTLTQTDVEQTQLEFANAESQVVSTRVAVENARITLERYGRAGADHGHGHREDGRARHGDRVDDAKRERRHHADEDGRPHHRPGAHARRRDRHRQDPTRHAHARDGRRVSESAVRWRGVENRAAGARRAERHAVFGAHQDRESRRVAEARHERRGADPDRKSRRRCGCPDGGAARRYRRDADGGHARARRERAAQGDLARGRAGERAAEERGLDRRPRDRAAGRRRRREGHGADAEAAERPGAHGRGAHADAHRVPAVRRQFARRRWRLGGGGGNFRRRQTARRRLPAAAAAASSSAALRRRRRARRPQRRLSVRRRILGHRGARRPDGARGREDRSHGPRVQRDRVGSRARRQGAALAEREPLRAAGALAGVHQPALRLDHAVPAAAAAAKLQPGRMFR